MKILTIEQHLQQAIDKFIALKDQIESLAEILEKSMYGALEEQMEKLIDAQEVVNEDALKIHDVLLLAGSSVLDNALLGEYQELMLQTRNQYTQVYSQAMSHKAFLADELGKLKLSRTCLSGYSGNSSPDAATLVDRTG